MKKYIPLIVTTAILLCSFASLAQEQQQTIDNTGRDAIYRPKIGLGAGIFTYLGDVRDNSIRHLFTTTGGFELNVAQNISPSFNLELRVIRGNITVNERSLERNLNFSSTIWNGSANVVYNFENLYQRPKKLQPFLSLGLGYLNFNSKTDLYNSNGDRYHYWDDGTIRDLPQDSELANAASHIQRDYNYETDLRELNLDSLGNYNEFALSIPISFGVDLKLSNRASLRLGTTFFYNTTDLIDNVSDAGEGMREGNSANDYFLFSSASFHYSLWGTGVSTEKDLYFEDVDFKSLMAADSDNDGVADWYDKCAQTKEGEEVNENGCPLDPDDDAIRGSRDEEPQSAPGAVVNTTGVTITDSMRLAKYSDSLAVPRKRIDEIYPSGPLNPKPESGTRTVKEEITESQLAELTEKVEKIQEQIKKEETDELSSFFESISQEITSKNLSSAEEIDSVIRSVEDVYQAIDKSEGSPEKLVVKESEKGSEMVIPAQFQPADYNQDHLITGDEVLKVIENYLDGSSVYTLDQVYSLIDYYNENMKGVRVINFGGTKAVYVDGVLNILPTTDKKSSEELKQSSLATKYPKVDLNKDGELTPDEINGAVKLFQAGSKLYTKEMLNRLIDEYLD